MTFILNFPKATFVVFYLIFIHQSNMWHIICHPPAPVVTIIVSPNTDNTIELNEVCYWGNLTKIEVKTKLTSLD